MIDLQASYRVSCNKNGTLRVTGRASRLRAKYVHTFPRQAMNIFESNESSYEPQASGLLGLWN